MAHLLPVITYTMNFPTMKATTAMTKTCVCRPESKYGQ